MAHMHCFKSNMSEGLRSSEEDTVLSSPSEEESSSVSSGGSEYVPTPERPVRGSVSGISLPTTISFIELSQLDTFIEEVNSCRGCKTSGCNGNLVPVNVDSVGKGGGVIIKYAWVCFKRCSA